MGGSHTFLAKFVHWFFVILYAYGIFKQLDDLEQLEDSGLLMFEVVFASVFLLIVLIRYFYMSRFETFLGANEPVPLIHKYLAKTVHRLMYFCLVLLPLTGLAIARSRSRSWTLARATAARRSRPRSAARMARPATPREARTSRSSSGRTRMRRLMRMHFRNF